MSDVADLVRRRFFRFTDPLAMGLPQLLQAHFIINSLAHDDRPGSVLQDIVTRIHNAANQLRPPCKQLRRFECLSTLTYHFIPFYSSNSCLSWKARLTPPSAELPDSSAIP